MGKYTKDNDDNHRWEKAKNAVKRVKKDRPETEWEDKDWRLANSLFHKMKKSPKKKA